MERTLDFDARMAELGRRIEGAKEIATVVDYFHEQLVSYPPLMEKSLPGRNALLEKCVCEGLGRAITMHAKRTDPTLASLANTQAAFVVTTFEVPSHGFWHGQAIGSGLIATFFGFEATSRFCLGISMPDLTATYLRITAAHVPAPPMPGQSERRPN